MTKLETGRFRGILSETERLGAMGRFRKMHRKGAGKHCAERKYNRRNPVVRVKSYASKSQIVDAYGILYRELLKHESMGHEEEARQIEQILNGFQRTRKEDDDKCIQVNEVCFNGDAKMRWIHINRIESVSKSETDTKIRFVDGGTMFVRETVDEVIGKIRRR